MRTTAFAALVLAVPLAATLACGSDDVIETDQGTVTVDRDDQTMKLSVEGENAFEMKTGEDIALPDGFPEDVPAYPGAKIVTSMASAEGMMLSSQSSADPKAVVDFYKEKLSGAGWTVEAEMNMGPQRIVSFTKGDRQVTVTAASEGGQTLISLMAGG